VLKTVPNVSELKEIDSDPLGFRKPSQKQTRKSLILRMHQLKFGYDNIYQLVSAAPSSLIVPIVYNKLHSCTSDCVYVKTK